MLLTIQCHKNLTIKLGPRINLIMGRNGSGKSTILTAISTCLGGKASNTNRAKNIAALIKEGEERGLIAVELANEGVYAYQPDVFGPSIIVERVLSKRSSTYRIKSWEGRVISTKRKDLDLILDSFEILIDNPFTVLTQDMARSFLATSSPETKYQYFERGLQFDKIAGFQEATKDSLLSQKLDLLVQKDTYIKRLKETWQAAKSRQQQFEKHEKAITEYASLRAALSWERVREKRRLIKNCSEKIVRIEDEMKQSRLDNANSDETIATLTLQIDDLNKKLSFLDDEIKESKQEAVHSKAQYNSYREKKLELEMEFKSMNRNLESVKTRINATQEKLDDLTSKSIESYDIAKREKAHRQDRLSGEIDNLKEKISSANEEESKLLEEYDTANNDENTASRLNSQIQLLEQSIDRDRESIAAVSKGNRDIYAGFHPRMSKLVQEIEDAARNGLFETKPLGPLGKHLKLKDANWSSVLEGLLNNTLDGFIVFSERDRVKLLDILKKIPGLNPTIFLRGKDLFSYEHQIPEAKFVTMLDVVDFDNEYVKRLFIDVHRAEQSILFNDWASAEAAMRVRPRNVANCYALNEDKKNGLSVGGRVAGSYSNRPINGRYGNNFGSQRREHYMSQPRIRMEISDELSALRAALSEKRARVRELSEKRDTLKAEADNIKRKHQILTSDLTKMRSQKSLLERQFEDLREELEKDEQEENLNAARLLREELSQLEESRERYDGQLDNNLEGIEDVKGQLKKVHHASEQVVKKVRELDRSKEMVESEVFKLSQELNRVKASHENFEEELREKQVRIEVEKEKRSELEGECRQLEEDTKTTFDSDEEVLLPAGHSVDGVIERMNELTSVIEQAGDLATQDFKAILAETEAARETFTTAKSQYQRMLSDFRLLSETQQVRKETYELLTAQTCSNLASHFATNLRERGFDGTLEIDRRNERLLMYIAPKGGQQRDVTTLSGGEKSYSQIALLLAIWKEMNSRLVALDEFDVFMDKVNRRISLSMVMENLRQRKYVQSIFITPQEMELGAVKVDENVNIHRMADPRST